MLRRKPESKEEQLPAKARRRERSGLCVRIERPGGRCRLSDLDEVPVRIAHVAAKLRRVDLWLGDEPGTPRRPEVVVAPDVGHAKVQKAAEHIWLSRWGSDNLGLVVGWSTSAVDDDPDVAESKKSRRSGA